jgi:hypothetical protein
MLCNPRTEVTPPKLTVRSLVQTLGPRRALDAAANLGYSGAAIAAVLEAERSVNDDWLQAGHSNVKPPNQVIAIVRARDHRSRNARM